MRGFILLVLLCLALPVAANERRDAARKLANVDEIYTIGPWQGATVSGENCQLVHTAGLNGVELSLSGIRKREFVTINLGNPFLGDISINKLNIKLDDGPNVPQQFGRSSFAMFVTPTDEELRDFTRARFATFTIGEGSVSFDLRGLEQAYGLFNLCLEGNLPDELPNMPLQESEPQPLAGALAADWQVTDLTFEGKIYQRLASLTSTDDVKVGLWVQNRAQYVLALTLDEDFSDLRPPYRARFTFAEGQPLDLPFVPQVDGVLITLPLSALKQLAAAKEPLSLQAGPLTTKLNLPHLLAVAQAIQFTD